MTETRALVNLGPRISGSDGAARAAEHLASRLRDLGLKPVIDEFRENTPIGATVFRNVLAKVGAKGQPCVVLLSHYDTMSGISPDFIGANDSGSSTGALLEMARVLRAHPPAHLSVLLAFVDGEESRTRYQDNDGLYGSRRLARRLRAEGAVTNVVGVIVLDMIGDRDLSVTIPPNGTSRLMILALDCARAEGVRDRFGMHPGKILDDHQPFLDAGMPAVNLIDFEYGSAPGRNDYWHTPGDTLDKLSSESLRTVGRVVLRMLNSLPQ